MRVAGMVARKYSMPVSPHDIEEYRKLIPDGMFLAFEQLVPDFGDVDVVMDVVGEMTSMLGLMRERIQAAQLVEENAGQPSARLDAMIKTYFLLLEKYGKALNDYGVISLKETKVAPVQRDDKPETLKEILDGKQAVSEVHTPALHREGAGEPRLLAPTNNQ